MEQVEINGFKYTYEQVLQGIKICEAYPLAEGIDAISIPSEIEGLPVLEIGENSIFGHGIKTIKIPSSVERISDYAFSKCPDVLEYAVEENSYFFEAIDGDLYTRGGKKLVKVARGRVIEEYFVDFEVEEIGAYAFSNSPVQHIFAGEGVIKIGEGAFSRCDQLSTVELCDKVEEIGKKAFLGCLKLKKIGVSKANQHFMDANGVLYTKNQDTIINFPSGIKEIKLPESVKKIEDYAFCCRLGIKEISLPKGLKHIGNSAFECCRNLATVEIKGTLDYIGKSAFMDCTALKSITLLKGETVIDEKSFKDCDRLEKIVLPEGLCKISTGMLQDCKSLKNVIIPSTVSKIEDYAFASCRSLEAIELSESITEIGEGAFGATGLKSVEIPSSVKYIGKNAFSLCFGLKTIDLSEGLKTIDSFAFDGSGLERVTLPKSLETIESYAFFCCTELTSVKIPKEVSVIAKEAFQFCHKLTVYCEAEEKPQTWDNNWCSESRAIFNCKIEE